MPQSSFWEGTNERTRKAHHCRPAGMAQDLPDLSACGGGKTPTGISVTNSGYIVTNSAGSCKMQLQMRLTYYMPK